MVSGFSYNFCLWTVRIISREFQHCLGSFAAVQNVSILYRRFRYYLDCPDGFQNCLESSTTLWTFLILSILFHYCLDSLDCANAMQWLQWCLESHNSVQMVSMQCLDMIVFLKLRKSESGQEGENYILLPWAKLFQFLAVQNSSK